MTLAHGCHAQPRIAIFPPQPATSGAIAISGHGLRGDDVGQHGALREPEPQHDQRQHHPEHAAEHAARRTRGRG